MLALNFIISTGLLLGGVILEAKSVVGSIMLLAFAVIFRFWMTYEWVSFFLEKRPHIRDKRLAQHIMGHLVAQAFMSTITIVCEILGWYFTSNHGLGPLLRQDILLVS